MPAGQNQTARKRSRPQGKKGFSHFDKVPQKAYPLPAQRWHSIFWFAVLMSAANDETTGAAHRVAQVGRRQFKVDWRIGPWFYCAFPVVSARISGEMSALRNHAASEKKIESGG